jgi:hypothetical protein
MVRSNVSLYIFYCWYIFICIFIYRTKCFVKWTIYFQLTMVGGEENKKWVRWRWTRSMYDFHFVQTLNTIKMATVWEDETTNEKWSIKEDIWQIIEAVWAWIWVYQYQNSFIQIFFTAVLNLHLIPFKPTLPLHSTWMRAFLTDVFPQHTHTFVKKGKCFSFPFYIYLEI